MSSYKNERCAWGSHDWSDAEISFGFGTLEVHFNKTSSDVLTSFSYGEDVYWQDSDSWLSEWRTSLASSPAAIELTPTSPNREVVARPIRDLYIPAKSETTIYVGYPSWVQAKVNERVVLAGPRYGINVGYMAGGRIHAAEKWRMRPRRMPDCSISTYRTSLIS